MYYEPYVGRAAIAVFEHNGYEVMVPPQNCCGLPLLSNGEFDAAANYHRNNVAKLAGYAKAGYPIVGTSTSCTLTFKEEAPELLDFHDEAATNLKWAHGTFSMAGGIVDAANCAPIFARFYGAALSRALPAARPSCRQTGNGDPWHGARAGRSESHARCCGIAGTYGYKVEKYQIAMDVGQELFDFVGDRETKSPTRRVIRRPAAGNWSMVPTCPAAIPSRSWPRPTGSTISKIASCCTRRSGCDA